MFRLGFGVQALAVVVLLSPMVGCRMVNPAFDFRETEALVDDGTEGSDEQDEAEGADEKSEGDGDGVPETGDGDGEPTTGDGDGDGEPTTGDGDGEPTTTGDGDGEGESSTTGDGDGDNTSESESGDTEESGETGDPILLDMGAIDLCPDIEPADECQLCAAQHCCFPGADDCFVGGTDCKCVLNCINVQMGEPFDCGVMCEAQPSAVEGYVAFNQCMLSSCDDSCN